MANLSMGELTQMSTVSVGESELTVVSQILLEPEAMMVTSVMHGERLLRRKHAPLSPAVIDDYGARGTDALMACLQGAHLRFVRTLLSSGDKPSTVARGNAPLGVIASMRLGAEGEVLSTAGEDEIPSSWLRGVYLLDALCSEAEDAFSLGKLTRASAEGASLRALLKRGDACTAVCFAAASEPSELGTAVDRYLEEMACGTESDS